MTQHARGRQTRQTHATRKANEARKQAAKYRDGKGHRRVLGSRNKAKRKAERRERRRLAA